MLAEDPANIGSMFVLIILGSDKTTVIRKPGRSWYTQSELIINKKVAGSS
jgi:protein associated with RNAse G/E